MSSDDRGRYTVIHHIGSASPGTGRPSGPYGLRLGDGSGQSRTPWAAADEQDPEGD